MNERKERGEGKKEVEEQLKKASSFLMEKTSSWERRKKTMQRIIQKTCTEFSDKAGVFNRPISMF